MSTLQFLTLLIKFYFDVVDYSIELIYFSFKFDVSVDQRPIELTYSNMQIIAREVELEAMRRSVPIQSTQNPSKPKKAPQQPSKPQNHLQKLITKSVNVRAKTKDLVCCSHFHSILCSVCMLALFFFVEFKKSAPKI